MRSFTLLPARRLVSFGLASLLLAGSAMPIFASGETGVTVSGGSLTGGSITYSNFSGVTLDGTEKTTTSTWSIANIVDARGTGAGWNLSLTLTQLKEYSGGSYVSGGKTIPTSAIEVTDNPSVSRVDGTSSPTSTITVVSDGTALDTGSAVTLLSAALDGGMGSYSFGDMTSTLTVPANTYARTDKSDATASLSTGP